MDYYTGTAESSDQADPGAEHRNLPGVSDASSHGGTGHHGSAAKTVIIRNRDFSKSRTLNPDFGNTPGPDPEHGVRKSPYLGKSRSVKSPDPTHPDPGKILAGADPGFEKIPVRIRVRPDL